MKLDGDDNPDDVVEAIAAYRKDHSEAETEQVVRDWFEEYDALLAAAIRTRTEAASRRSATVYNGYWYCQDSPNYQNCVARRRAEMRGSHDDRLSDSAFTVGRVQQIFMRVREGIARHNLRYKWFKVRNGNGQGSF